MSDTNGGEDARDQFRDRRAHQELGTQIQDLLVKGNFLADERRSTNEAADLGRLVLAFAALPDMRVRNALISLMETVAKE